MVVPANIEAANKGDMRPQWQELTDQQLPPISRVEAMIV